MSESNKILRLTFSALLSLFVLLSLSLLIFKTAKIFPDLLVGYLCIILFFSLLTLLFCESVENKLVFLSIIIFLPIVGCAITLFFIIEKLVSKKPYVKKSSSKSTKEFQTLAKTNQSFSKVAIYVEKQTNCPLIFGNSVVLFCDSRNYLKSIIYDVKQANSYVLMEFYIMKEGSMFAELISEIYNAVSRGVKVSITVDFVGSGDFAKSSVAKSLKKRGVVIKTFKPPKFCLGLWHNTRTHRKLVVIDGKTAYLGGINFSDDELQIKDVGMRFIGDVAKQIESMFYRLDGESFPIEKSETLFQDGFIQPFSVSGKKIIEDVYIGAINCSRREILIVTPYLTLSERMFKALVYQRLANVKIKVIIPSLSGKIIKKINTVYAEKLSEIGCEIYYYNKSFIHQKMLIVDNDLCVSGSPNFDVRSSSYQIESGVIFYNNRVIDEFIVDYNLCLASSDRAIFTKKRKGFFKWASEKVTKLIAYFV